MRWYDQSLGRFIQPDTLVPNPGDPIAFDRYHYSRNSPLRYVDPSGHSLDCAMGEENCDAGEYEEPISEENIPPTDKLSDEAFPGDYDYWSLSIYFGGPGTFLALLFSQLEPTPFTELFIPVTGRLLSGGVTISGDRNGGIYLALGGSVGRTIVSDPMPNITFNWGYLESNPTLGDGVIAPVKDTESLLTEWSRNHSICGQVIPCLGRTYSLTNDMKATEGGFGIPNVNFFTVSYGWKLR